MRVATASTAAQICSGSWAPADIHSASARPSQPVPGPTPLHRSLQLIRVLLLEFTIEPFVEGQPGPHVMSAIEAAQSLGYEIDFGPFGSSCNVPADQAGLVAQAVLDAAYANGATHVSLHTERLPENS